MQKNIPNLVNFIPKNSTTLYVGRNSDVVFAANGMEVSVGTVPPCTCLFACFTLHYLSTDSCV
jgi:hypothetical protein